MTVVQIPESEDKPGGTLASMASKWQFAAGLRQRLGDEIKDWKEARKEVLEEVSLGREAAEITSQLRELSRRG